MVTRLWCTFELISSAQLREADATQPRAAPEANIQVFIERCKQLDVSTAKTTDDAAKAKIQATMVDKSVQTMEVTEEAEETPEEVTIEAMPEEEVPAGDGGDRAEVPETEETALRRRWPRWRRPRWRRPRRWPLAAAQASGLPRHSGADTTEEGGPWPWPPPY